MVLELDIMVIHGGDLGHWYLQIAIACLEQQTKKV